MPLCWALFLWLLLPDSLPSPCWYQRKHPPTAEVHYTLLKASPLPLTLVKLESFSIVEPEGNAGQPYPTGACCLQLYFPRTKTLQNPAGFPEFSELHREEPQLVPSRGSLPKPFRKALVLHEFQSKSDIYAMRAEPYIKKDSTTYFKTSNKLRLLPSTCNEVLQMYLKVTKKKNRSRVSVTYMVS